MGLLGSANIRHPRSNIPPPRQCIGFGTNYGQRYANESGGARQGSGDGPRGPLHGSCFITLVHCRLGRE